MARTEPHSVVDALALAWARGADAAHEYHEKRNDWLTWEGKETHAPALPSNPYRNGDDHE